MNVKVLAAVAVVVAALLGLGIVKPRLLQCRAKQREATTNLKEAQKRLGIYVLKNGRATSSWGDLAWEPRGTKRYVFSIDVVGSTGFVVHANPRTNEMNGDHWRIDEAGVLTNEVDGCARHE